MTEDGNVPDRRSALVIIDMVNDFVTGVLGSEAARNTAMRISEIMKVVDGRIMTVFTRDSHIEGDPEFAVWGEHCLIGTEGNRLCPELKDFGGFDITKRHFDSFFESDLDGLLRARKINHLYLCGISTDICVLHTASGAFHRYYGITVVEDMCSSLDPSKHSIALNDMKTNYGAEIITSDQLIREVEQHEKRND